MAQPRIASHSCQVLRPRLSSSFIHSFFPSTTPAQQTEIQTSRRIVDSDLDLHVGSVLTWIFQTSRRNAMAQQSLKETHPHGVDLLRNRDPGSPLGPFDGKVAAWARIGAQHFFITTNAGYVPAVPSLQLPHAVYLRSDMRYGTDDPTLWPQQWTAQYCHLPLIAQKGTRPDIDVMWWDFSRNDFQVGSALTRGLGRLQSGFFSRFLPPVNKLVAQCKELRRTSPALTTSLFGELIQHLLMLLEQLQTLPTTYPKMLFAVTSMQRAFLELDALYNYMTVYKQRMNDYMAPHPTDTAVAQFVGAFTTVPTVAQQLWAARVPVWFLRPYEVFDKENILAIVPLREPMFSLPDPDAHGEGAPPALYCGNSTQDKISAIQRAARHTPWYHDPFETNFTRAPSPTPASASSPFVAPPGTFFTFEDIYTTHRLPPATPVPSGSRAVAKSNNQLRFKPCMFSLARNNTKLMFVLQIQPKPRNPLRLRRPPRRSSGINSVAQQCLKCRQPSSPWPRHCPRWIAPWPRIHRMAPTRAMCSPNLRCS